MSTIRKIIDVVVLVVVVLIGLDIFLIRYVSKKLVLPVNYDSRFVRMLVVPDGYDSIRSAIDEAKPGDTVFIKAGIYEERIRFKNGIRLVGEETDKVVIQCEAQEGHVLFSCGESGLIKNLTIEQTGRDKVYPKAIPVGIYLRNSSVKVTGCRVSRTDGYGIIVQDMGSPVIRNCVLESSRLSGIYVVGASAKPTIENNEIRFNGQYGIHFDKGAKGSAEGNICQGNGQIGIYASRFGTRISLKNNHCRQNGTHGICFYRGANGVAKENVCVENGDCGICVSNSDGAVTVSSNLCRKNKACGIYFEGPVNATVENNICSDNVQHGIKFINSARGIAKNNVCYGNLWPGILVSDSDTSITLQNNRVRGNKPPGE